MDAARVGTVERQQGVQAMKILELEAELKDTRKELAQVTVRMERLEALMGRGGPAASDLLMFD